MDIIRKQTNISFESSIAVMEKHKPVSPFVLRELVDSTIPEGSDAVYAWAAEVTANVPYNEVLYVRSTHPFADEEFPAATSDAAVVKFDSGYGIVIWGSVGLQSVASCTFNGDLKDFALFKAEFERYGQLKPLF